MRTSALHFTRNHPPTLEQLEDRTLLAGNLLITAGNIVFPATTYLMEYTQQGQLLNSQLISLPPGSTDTNPVPRGLSVDPSGNVNIYDGTSTPALATYSAANNSWTTLTTSGWSTNPNLSYGEVAAYKNFVFASDMDTPGAGTANGIIRFDTTDGSSVRFAQGTDFIQVTLGQDGLIYGLETNGAVQVYNPDTLAFVRSFTLQGGPDSDIRSIAVDGSGTILAATWGGYIVEYDPNGSYTGTSIQLKDRSGNGEHILNIALDTDGQVAVGSSVGDVFLTDESLSSPTVIHTTQTNPLVNNTFVTFDHYIGTQTVTPSFDALAAPTISYGQSSVTLGGRITAGNSYPPGSVSITLAGMTESAAIDPTDGTFSTTFDTSTLGVSGSPYTITYSYPGQSRYTAISDSSNSLTVNQATTSLINLSAPAIVYGTQTTFSGTVGSNSVLPVGQEVSVTLQDSSGTAVAGGNGTIAGDGSFQVAVDTSKLAASSYTIQYSYAGDTNFKGSSDSSNSLSISQATITLSNLSSPTEIVGTKTISLSGVVGSNSVLPVGQDVTVTLIGAKGTVASASSVIGSDGSFQVNLITHPLPVGSYTIQYTYAGDGNFTASSGTGTLLVSHAVHLVYAPSHPVHGEAKLPLVVQVRNASGRNLSSSNLIVSAIALIGPNGGTYIPKPKGHANLDNEFHRMGGVYVYNLDTAGLTPGTYTLLIQVGNDPILHALTFVIASPKRSSH